MANILDIIIPIYNTPEEYLVRALNSINRQKNLDLKMIGVIIIDNASKEIKYKKSWFKQRFPKLQITFIVNEKNIGPGLSRQVGIDYSEAKYITFLDSDDELYGSDSIAKVLACLEKFDVDRLSTAIIEEVFLNNCIHTVRHDLTTLNSLHGFFIKNEVLKKNNIRFSNTLKHHEDYYFVRIVNAFTSDSNAYLDEVTYNWKWNDKSIMRSYSEKYVAFDDEVIATFDSNEIILNAGKKSHEVYVSGIIRLYILLSSNIAEVINKLESKEKYEKRLYEVYVDNREIIDEFDEEYIYKVVSSRLESFHRSNPWVVLTDNFFEYFDKLEKKYNK